MQRYPDSFRHSLDDVGAHQETRRAAMLSAGYGVSLSDLLLALQSLSPLLSGATDLIWFHYSKH